MFCVKSSTSGEVAFNGFGWFHPHPHLAGVIVIPIWDGFAGDPTLLAFDNVTNWVSKNILQK